MASLRIERSIAADPTSTALLLAGPAAFDFWPGLRRIAAEPHAVVAETDLPVSPVSVRAAPPRRTPTSFVTTFSFSGPGLVAATGTVTLTYAPAAGVRPATTARLDLDLPALPGALYAEVHRRASGFLDNLARAAEQRSDAA